MASKKITVPEAGKSQSFQMTGLSVIVISAPSYFSPIDAPKISFNDEGDNLPALVRSVWPSNAGKFKTIIVTGTQKSAGDQIQLLTVNECLPVSFNPVKGTKKAIAGNTLTKQMDGTVQQLDKLVLSDDQGNLPESIYISAKGGNINYRWNDGAGSDPAIAGSDFQLKDGAVPIEILGVSFILNLRFINSVSAETPYLIIELRY
jgi:hypothetical protein